jgi:hypothetical protein
MGGLHCFVPRKQWTALERKMQNAEGRILPRGRVRGPATHAATTHTDACADADAMQNFDERNAALCSIPYCQARV